MESEGASLDENREALAALEMNGSKHETLSTEETDHLTRAYCLLAQGDPKEHEIPAFYLVESRFPTGRPVPLQAPISHRAGSAAGRVRAVIGRELPPLRVICERRLAAYDQPAQAEAVKEALRRDARRASVLRVKKQNEKWFHAYYKLLLEMRKDFVPPSALPAGPVAARARKRNAAGKQLPARG